MLEEEGRKGVTGWVSGWLGGTRAVQSVPTTPQRPGYNQNLNGVSVLHTSTQQQKEKQKEK